MRQKLVNIITPAYNAANYLPRLLDSISKQTYSHIEMFVIDDGSTDKTKDLIEVYKVSFEKSGKKLHYVYQENAGQSAALNNGLKFVTGDYLLWPDADDWYKEKNAIEIMVSELDKYNDDIVIARCQYEYIDESSGSVIKVSEYQCEENPANILDDAIYRRNGFNFLPGGYIIKTKFLEKFIPNREIFVNKYTGQNAQILYPYLSYGKCLSINKPLFCYLVRENSHSHIKGYDAEIRREEAHLKNFISTFDRINNWSELQEKEYYYEAYKYFYSLFLKLDFDYRMSRAFHYHYKQAIGYGLVFSRRYMYLYYWTTLFSIKSYLRISNIINFWKI